MVRPFYLGWVLCGLLWSGWGAGAEPVYTVNRVQVNIRDDATVQGRRIAVLDQGEEVEFLRRKDEWFQVRLPDGRNGWVHGNLVQERVVVLGRTVHVRAAGSTQAQSLGTVAQGQELGRIRQVGDWSEVALPDGRSGWMVSRFLRGRIRGEPTAPPAVVAEPAVTPTPSPAEPPPQRPDPVETPVEVQPDLALQRNHYAEGLQFEAGSQYREALASFEAVLEQDPQHLKALHHAAQVHIRLDQLDAALDKLYRALEYSDGRPDSRFYLSLGEVYRIKGKPDSVRKYQALFKGEIYPNPVPLVNAGIEPVEPQEDRAWFSAVLIGVGVGLGLLAIAAFLWSRRAKMPDADAVADQPPKGKFNQVMEEADQAPLEHVGPGEEEELDRQINAKWVALQQGTASFVKPETWNASALEESQLEELLGQLEDLRNGLEQQDQRAAIYADIVRLQNMKIEALNDEIRLLRRQGAD